MLKERMEQQRAWRAKNIEKVRAYGRKHSKQFRERNPERLKEIRKKEYNKNRERYLAKSRAWRLANPERYKAQMQASQERIRAKKKQPHCMSCESILKEQSLYCEWCVSTYSYA